MPLKDSQAQLQSSSKFGFLDLPPELRNQIYDYVFEGDILGSKNLRLLLTCRQIYREAKVKGFEKTTFWIPKFRDLNLRQLSGRSGSSRLSDSSVDYIKKIRISSFAAWTLKRTAAFSSLPVESVEIRLYNFDHADVEYTAYLFGLFPHTKEIMFCRGKRLFENSVRHFEFKKLQRNMQQFNHLHHLER